jgi:hypothetical protein
MDTHVITMQSSQADQVRGLTVIGHALAPVPTLSNILVLPFECASDPFHADRQALLQSFPHFTLASSNLQPVPSSDGFVTWPSSMQTFVADCTYRSSWPVGQTIAVSAITVST